MRLLYLEIVAEVGISSWVPLLLPIAGETGVEG